MGISFQKGGSTPPPPAVDPGMGVVDPTREGGRPPDFHRILFGDFKNHMGFSLLATAILYEGA